jgi:hypothetical protein
MALSNFFSNRHIKNPPGIQEDLKFSLKRILISYYELFMQLPSSLLQFAYELIQSESI